MTQNTIEWNEFDVRLYDEHIVSQRHHNETYEPLRELYARVGIPSTNPAERARYLADEVLQMDDHTKEMIVIQAAEKGPAIALGILEMLALQCHIREEIDLTQH